MPNDRSDGRPPEDVGASRLPGPARWHGRPAAFFDLDKTIIAKSSALAFSRSFYSGGLLDRRSALRSTYTQLTFLLGRADHDQMERMREFLSRMVTGWNVETVRDIVAETLHSIIDPLVYDEAVTLMEEHHLAGRDVIIVSASGAEIVEPIGELLGVDDVIASRLAVQGVATRARSSSTPTPGTRPRRCAPSPVAAATTCSAAGRTRTR